MRLCVKLHFLFLAVFSAGASCDDTWKHELFSGKQGALTYRLFIPQTVTATTRFTPLVVMLHGCLQNSLDFALGTSMNELAASARFSVLYPEQPKSKNPLQCWNWFLKQNQSRASGEASLIAELVDDILKKNPFLDPKKVYVAGISAGGAMSHILGVCYPDKFAAVAVHSGVGFGFSRNSFEAKKAMNEGSQHSKEDTDLWARSCSNNSNRTTPTLLIHGTKDSVVSSVNVHAITEQLLSLAGLKESGALLSYQKVQGTSQDVRTYLVREYGSQTQLLCRSILVDNLEHAWSGGNPDFKFNDPSLPSSSHLIWDFFKSLDTQVKQP